jgi:hypothetical protein
MRNASSLSATQRKAWLLMGFREHGIAVAIRSAQKKNALPPGSKHHGAYGEKSRPAANERFASMAGEANVRCEAVAGSIKRTSN